jgi:hypothetical protein
MKTKPDYKTCPQCGAPLPGDAPGGLCARCLMSMNLAESTAMGTEPVQRVPAPTPEEIGKVMGTPR